MKAVYVMGAETLNIIGRLEVPAQLTWASVQQYR
jgi:hypothetical protein